MKYTEEQIDIIEKFKDIIVEIKRVPTDKELKEDEDFKEINFQKITKNFGSIFNLITAFKEKYRKEYNEIRVDLPLSKKDSLLLELRNLIIEKNKVPSLRGLSIKNRGERKGLTRSSMSYHFGTIPKALEEIKEKFGEDYFHLYDPQNQFRNENQINKSKNLILKECAKWVKNNKKYPKVKELTRSANVRRETIYNYFSSIKEVHEQARDKYPKYFKDILDPRLFNAKKFKEMSEDLKRFKRFVVTTAVADSEVNVNFLKSLKVYCEHNEAALLILPANNKVLEIDVKLSKEYIIYDELKLNNNLHLSTIKLNPKQIDPITGLARIGQRQGSYIFASPKQRLKYCPVSKNKLPHALMTTGAITLPNYQGIRYQQFRTDYIADNDHIMGAVIVEIEDKEHYHFRQIQTNDSGVFYDLNKKYDPEGVTDSTPEAFVMGDLHCLFLDKNAFNSWKEAIKYTEVNLLFLHDIFDGKSISHHDEKKLLHKAWIQSNFNADLEGEVLNVVEILVELSKYVDNIVVVKSNHDEFLERYLEEGRFMKDSVNCTFAIELAQRYLKGLDPLEEACRIVASKYTEDISKVSFLKSEEDYIVKGVQLGSHGHLGANGARGSVKSMEVAFGNSMSAHTHIAEILRNTWKVGTTSQRDIFYNRGFSSWTQTSGFVHPNGGKQLINHIQDGKYSSWKLDD